MNTEDKMTFADFYSEYCGKDFPEKDLVKLCWIMAQKNNETLRIGKYQISLNGDSIQISNDDGESGDFNITTFEKVVDKFFNDNF